MFNPGDKVIYLGFRNNLYGDTDQAEEDGILVINKIYTVVATHREDDTVAISCDRNDGGDHWWLHQECLKKAQEKIRNLPTWW